MGVAVRWNEDEISQLVNLAKKFSLTEVTEMLHRPQTSVRVKAKELGITFQKNSNFWSAEQDEYLKNNWNTDSVSNIASYVRKSKAGVYIRARALNLAPPNTPSSHKLPKQQLVRLCSKCKKPNDREAPALKCSICYVGRPKPKGTGWSSRRCLNCNAGYSGKTRDYCTKDCKSEAATKARMKVLGNSDLIKTCKKCDKLFPIYQFNLDSSRKDKVHPYCRECQKLTKGLTAENARNRRLLNFYGITLEEYTALLAAQNGHCAMCTATPTDRNLAVDHDHLTGAVRGLLCLTCNKYKLGQLTIEDVDKIYAYLHNPPATAFFGMTRYVPEGMEKPKKKRRRKVK